MKVENSLPSRAAAASPSCRCGSGARRPLLLSLWLSLCFVFTLVPPLPAFLLSRAAQTVQWTALVVAAEGKHVRLGAVGGHFRPSSFSPSSPVASCVSTSLCTASSDASWGSACGASGCELRAKRPVSLLKGEEPAFVAEIDTQRRSFLRTRMSPLRAFLPHPAAEMVSLEAARERGAHTPCACSPSHSPADSRGGAPSRRASLSRAAPCAASPSSVSSVSSAVSAPVSLASGGGAASASACPLPAPLARPPHPLILLCGPPCSGKGSLATLLCRRLAFSHVSTGDLLRRFLQRRSARAQTEDARERAGEGKAAGAEDSASKKSRDDESSHADEASRALQSGGLVSDALIVQLLHREMERLSRRHAKEEEEPSHAAPEERGRARGYRGGVVLEGFPRSAEQVDMLYAINCTPDAVVCLDVKDTVLFQRMGGRLIDPETAQVYGAANPPPAAILHRLVRRDDDKQDVLENRIELYRRSWRDISRRLRSHSQWRALQQEERALYRAGRTPEDLGGHTLVEERERRSVERLQDATLHAAVEALERKDAEGKTTGEVGEEEPHEDIGIIDGSRHIEDVYGDVLVFLRKKFGDKIEEQTLQTPAS